MGKMMNQMGSMCRHLGVLATLVMLAGCASKPEIVQSSVKRLPTTAGDVVIYDKQPAKYEQLGTVTVTKGQGGTWDQKGDANAAFDALKAKAAAMGANGLLIWAEEGAFDRRVNAGYHGTFHQLPVRGTPGEGIAQAIYVLKK